MIDDENDTELPEAPSLSEVLARLEAINKELEQHHIRAAARERIIDRLHDQNQELRSGEHRQILRPILTDLQLLRNELLRQAKHLPDLTTEATAALLASYADSIGLSLERAGVAVLEVQPGVKFDPGSHRAVAVRPAGGEEQDGTVAEVISDGYVDTETSRTTVQAAVAVFTWAPPSNLDAAQEGTT